MAYTKLFGKQNDRENNEGVTFEKYFLEALEYTVVIRLGSESIFEDSIIEEILETKGENTGTFSSDSQRILGTIGVGKISRRRGVRRHADVKSEICVRKEMDKKKRGKEKRREEKRRGKERKGKEEEEEEEEE
ncbi:hypothetical protein V1477_001148 [Vespula maculifrons]|uniref:Uncharacterized protein n=1 Tax=Vespula maculifrons TaxID=7453 RepID=A0ABD2CZL8_VESMC